MVSLKIANAGREHMLTFTGDLGRKHLPILRDPAPVPPGDLVISESTYGGRTHDTAERMAARMAEIVSRTSARGGKVIIPAFSLLKVCCHCIVLRPPTRHRPPPMPPPTRAVMRHAQIQLSPIHRPMANSAINQAANADHPHSKAFQ